MSVDYSEALRLMKQGYLMRRAAWKPDKWVYVVNPTKRDKLSYLEISTAEGLAPYTPSRCDQFVDDWVEAKSSSVYTKKFDPFRY
jgi:hypothetical protein